MAMRNRQKNNFMLLKSVDEEETVGIVEIVEKLAPEAEQKTGKSAKKTRKVEKPETPAKPEKKAEKKTKGRRGINVSDLDFPTKVKVKAKTFPESDKAAVQKQEKVDRDASDEESATPQPSSETDHKRHHKRHKPAAKSTKLIFLVGAIVGVLGALYFGASNSSVGVEFPDFDTFVNFDSMSALLDDWKSVLPSSVNKMMSDFMETSKLHGSAESFAVGRSMQKEGLSTKFPVVMVPGVISTGLESWGLDGTEGCPSEQHFRKRLWGSFYMMKTMVMDKTCWLKHIMLDTETGLDPPNIRVRAAQGFEAADFFMAGYWIWNKILQNLAVIGYNPENMVSAAYDWRLSYLDLEIRDGYFSRLKSAIELQKKNSPTGEKSLLVGHSMGSQIIFYFMKWVEASGENFGNGGPNWVNDHVSGFVDISGSMLGTPKAIPALLSGEMKDTIQLNSLAVQGLEKFFSRRERVDMLRSFGGIASMLPKGGKVIWGDQESAPDDEASFMNINSTDNDAVNAPIDTYGNFISFPQVVGKYSAKNLTMDESIDFLLDQTSVSYKKRTKQHYSYGITKSRAQLKKNNQDYSKWVNPLEAELPNAPDMKIYCFYGVGNPTERSYTYREELDKSEHNLNVTIELNSQNAVKLADGDGTVSILTHTMCHKWKQAGSIYNPGNSRVTIVEMKHEPDRFDIRGGAKTAEHVDILGSAELNELVLRVASGKGDEIEDRYVSNLKEVTEKMDF
ncbi:hypothetical protein BABINDRAFT_159470 [Babjeviella inositovora NRRL Y-12698]|uniref:Phospholipid:diacylglycerol acyltransferase n=1 Tax=Babjeviella inositovora NRRL Y-12698 TaxID=984486 RepID=A0A1E3R0W7_9ASCO|nr:uncharacterized protein BABINDRAFT_159470 [Babjeviella inositovora NRRL Y-12698]ODQ82992.1 hypothetical protein BABINDRAFT_159470 [Babjeviella inositovora NRRL Y-12698]